MQEHAGSHERQPTPLLHVCKRTRSCSAEGKLHSPQMQTSTLCNPREHDNPVTIPKERTRRVLPMASHGGPADIRHPTRVEDGKTPHTLRKSSLVGQVAEQTLCDTTISESGTKRIQESVRKRTRASSISAAMDSPDKVKDSLSRQVSGLIPTAQGTSPPSARICGKWTRKEQTERRKWIAKELRKDSCNKGGTSEVLVGTVEDWAYDSDTYRVVFDDGQVDYFTYADMKRLVVECKNMYDDRASLLGKWLVKEFVDDATGRSFGLFRGKVHEWAGKTDVYVIKFEDGQEEVLTHAETKELVDASPHCSRPEWTSSQKRSSARKPTQVPTADADPPTSRAVDVKRDLKRDVKRDSSPSAESRRERSRRPEDAATGTPKGRSRTSSTTSRRLAASLSPANSNVPSDDKACPSKAAEAVRDTSHSHTPGKRAATGGRGGAQRSPQHAGSLHDIDPASTQTHATSSRFEADALASFATERSNARARPHSSPSSSTSAPKTPQANSRRTPQQLSSSSPQAATAGSGSGGGSLVSPPPGEQQHARRNTRRASGGGDAISSSSSRPGGLLSPRPTTAARTQPGTIPTTAARTQPSTIPTTPRSPDASAGACMHTCRRRAPCARERESQHARCSCVGML